MNRSRPVPAALLTMSVAITRPATAQSVKEDESTDAYELPDAPAPPTLPDLTHRALAASLESTFASIRGNVRPDGSDPGRYFGWTERLEVEQAIANRRWYVGVNEQLALGKANDGAFHMVGGNPEIVGRALWASKAGLAYGGGIGFVLPAIRHGTTGSEVAQSIRAVRPWDYVDFNDHFTLRPFVDVRDIDGAVILQLRQGIDWDKSGGALTSRTTFYIGYRPNEFFGLGLEAWEVYLIQAPPRTDATGKIVYDDGRAAYAVSPSIRFMTRMLQPAISVLLPLDRPLLESIDSFWAVRLSVQAVIDPK